MTSGLEIEWDYSGRNERDGQKKKIDKANEKRKSGKVKKEQTTRKWMDKGRKGGRRCPSPTWGSWLQSQNVKICKSLQERVQNTNRSSECRARLVMTYQDTDYCRREPRLMSVHTDTHARKHHRNSHLAGCFLNEQRPLENLTAAGRMYGSFHIIIMSTNTCRHLTAITHENLCWPAPPGKNWRILLKQSFIARMPLTKATRLTSAFG